MLYGAVMPPESRRGLPTLTITITTAPPGTVCGIGRRDNPHPADEHYEYSDHGAAINRCIEHGGERMRKSLRGKGHRIRDRIPRT